MRIVQWIDELRDDLRFGARQMAGAPAFSIVAILTLALGIGANAAIFALVDAALLRALPLPNPQRLVLVWERTATDPQDGASPLNMTDWYQRSRTIESIGGFVPSVGSMVLAAPDGTADTVPRQWVTSGIFDALGVKPVVGRTFQPDDDRRRANVAVLGEAFWKARFGADPSVVGRNVRLDGEPYTIVGVVPREAELIGRSSIWALRSFNNNPVLRRIHPLEVVARLKPGVTIAAAASDVSGVADALAREFPDTNKGRGVALEPLRDAFIGRDLRLTSVLFIAVVAFVLVICCANIANLLMARATVRARELATRAALGAGRPRIVRQLLTESLLLAAVGGLLGVGVGATILRIAPALMPEGLLPPGIALAFDARVFWFCASAVLIVGILFGLAPAWQATACPVAQTLASDSRTSTARGGRLRSLLVGAQVATAVVLLFGAGLLLRTLIAVDDVDRGYRADRVLTMMVDPLGSKYPTAASLVQFFEQIDEQIAALPGVRSSAWTSSLPMGDSVLGSIPFEIVGDPPVVANPPTADYAIVSPSYFETMDLPLVAGRGFGAGDTQDSAPVCVVNEAFVRRYVHGRSPIGARVALQFDSRRPATIREIVGVARQTRKRPDEVEPVVQLYVPLAQSPVDDMYLLVRPSTGPAEALAGSVRAAIGRVDREQLVSVRDVLTLDDLASVATARHRFRAVMVATFAGLALLLAMVGVFGVLAYSIQQRAKDLAVRRALGATTRDLFRIVAGSALRVVAAGAGAGLLLAAILGRFVTTMLFGVQPLDPLTFVFVMIVLAVTALISIAGPTWRAARIDPANVLRGA